MKKEGGAVVVEPSRETPVVAEADVVVAGGGPAGFAAAVVSARSGARTLLVERYGVLGGTATVGLVGPFMTSSATDELKSEQIMRGIFDEVVSAMVSLGGAIDPREIAAGQEYSSFHTTSHGHVTPFNPEILRYVTMKMARESGCQILLHTFVSDAIVKGGKIEALIVENKSGRGAIRCGVVVDATGDADVAARAGVPFDKGRESDGLMQPVSVFFRVGNVDTAKVKEYVATSGDRHFKELVKKARAKGEFIDTRDDVGIYHTSRPGEWWVNTVRVLKVDGTKAEELTRAELEGREQIMVIMNFFRKYMPGFENVQIVDSAIAVGVRETRRIKGEYALTARDCETGGRFDDVIARYRFEIDIHNPTGFGNVGRHLPPGVTYDIPYRCLVPVKIDNLLVAGRCLSATHEAQGSVRVMPPCMGTGQAAGVAAALAVRSGVAPRSVDVKAMQRTLLAQGAYLGDAKRLAELGLA